MITKSKLIESLKVVCWLAELVTNGPDVYLKHVIDAMCVQSEIISNWPTFFKEIVNRSLEESLR